MSKKVKSTEKQKLFIKAKMENPGISNIQAALQAGYSINTAKNAGKNIIEKRGVDLFVEKLASDEIIGKKLNEGLEAYKIDITGDAQPDFKTRLSYIQEIVGLKGYRQQANVLIQQNFNSTLSNERKEFEL